jgi:FlaA1/EpsC-like NDP-sugar epimerase
MAGEGAPRRLWRSLVIHRFAAIGLADAAFWAAAIAAGLVLRYEFDVPAHAWTSAWPAILAAGVAQLVLGTLTGAYTGRWQLGAFEEVLGLVASIGGTTAVLVIMDATWNVVPLSILVFAPAVALVLSAASRYAWRMSIERRARPGDAATPILVYGAGEGGQQAITAMLRNPASPYVPVGLIDDDPRKANRELRRVPVLGRGEHLGEAAARTGAEALLIAIPSADGALVRDLAHRAAEAGLTVKVLPPVDELLGNPVGVDDIRALQPEDLLGRRVIDTDVDAIAGYLTGKRVLVTGAGGSIGSELCRQIQRFAPDQLVMLDRDESALHGVQLSIEGRALLDDDNLVVADIRDRERMAEVFEQHRPEVVFHAAALKHLPLLERHPGEALKTNVWGTQHVLEAAERYGVERFVNISTDKAADPISVLGRTKRITEQLTAHAAKTSVAGTYLSVRFGNVLGSRGSVLTSFRAQIAAGGPITVTHPEVTRYFMTIEESVQLVIQAGAIGGGGDALVLDMGQPVRIADVARQMAEQSDRPIELVFTGLRDGEKLHEVLLGKAEVSHPTEHELIVRVGVDAMSIDAVDSLGQVSQSNRPAVR